MVAQINVRARFIDMRGNLFHVRTAQQAAELSAELAAKNCLSRSARSRLFCMRPTFLGVSPSRLEKPTAWIFVVHRTSPLRQHASGVSVQRHRASPLRSAVASVQSRSRVCGFKGQWVDAAATRQRRVAAKQIHTL